MATAIPKACLASSAIRCRAVETGPNRGVLAVFPSTGATCRCPLPSTGSRGLNSPASPVSGRRRRPSKGSPPSAAQTVRAVFPHTAFTRLPGGREMEGINEWTFCSPVGLSQSTSLLGRSLLGLSHKELIRAIGLTHSRPAVSPTTLPTDFPSPPGCRSRGRTAFTARQVSGRRRRPSKGSPPSAAQTVRAVFPHTAFTRLPGGREMEGINEWTFCSPVGLSQSASLLGRSLLGLSHKELIRAIGLTHSRPAVSPTTLPTDFPSPPGCRSRGRTAFTARQVLFGSVRLLARHRLPLRRQTYRSAYLGASRGPCEALLGSRVVLPYRAVCTHLDAMGGWNRLRPHSAGSTLPHLWPTSSSWDRSLDYSPVLLLIPFRFHLAVDTLSSAAQPARDGQ